MEELEELSRREEAEGEELRRKDSWQAVSETAET